MSEAETSEQKTCGDFGGTTHSGEPCTRPAGWGRDEDTGPCKNHQAEQVAQQKEDFISALNEEANTIDEAVSEIEASRSTVYRWRRKDDDFDQKVEEAKQEYRSRAAEELEESVITRAIEGEEGAAVQIFLLKNLMPEKYQDDPEVVVNQNQSQMSKQGMSQEELKEILGDGLEKARERDWNSEDSGQRQVQEQESSEA